MPKLWQHSPGRPPKGALRTTVTFSAEDLAALGELLAAGRVLLRHRDGPTPPVLARVKAAMTRIGLPVPAGL
jgi:hypothetical protein